MGVGVFIAVWKAEHTVTQKQGFLKSSCFFHDVEGFFFPECCTQCGWSSRDSEPSFRLRRSSMYRLMDESVLPLKEVNQAAFITTPHDTFREGVRTKER